MTIQKSTKAKSAMNQSIIVAKRSQLRTLNEFNPTRKLYDNTQKPLVSQPLLIQPKLSISHPGDRYEREADRLADRVMLMPDQSSERQSEVENEIPYTSSLNGQITRILQRQVEGEEEEEEELLQTKGTYNQAQKVSAGLKSGLQSLGKSGYRLPQSIRSFFEPRFGHDFSQVQVHTNTTASRTAQAAHAKAFTIGRNIVFGAGQYSPDTSGGRRLLAHELTHVVQQGEARQLRNASSGHYNRANQELISPLSRLAAKSTILRQEATFITGTGNGYLNNAESFHRAWGYPNVRRASSLEGVIHWVGSNIHGNLSRLRIVTHANNASIITSLLQRGGRETTTEMLEAARGGLMPVLSRFGGHIASTDIVARTFTFLRSRQGNVAADVLQRLGAAQDPTPGSSLHGLVWWMLDLHFVRNARVTGGHIPSRPRVITMINTNIRLLRNALSQEVVMSHPGQTMEFALAQRDADLRSLEAGVTRFLSIFHWRPVTSGEATGISRRIRQESGAIQQAISRGTFEDDLESVRSLIGLSTTIEIRGCRIGQSRSFLEQLQRLFEGTFRPRVSAPDYYQYYGHPGFRIVPNTDRQLRALWNNRTIRRAFIAWWNVIYPGRPAPGLDDFKAYLRSGEVFPSGSELITIRNLAPDSVVSWLVRHNYHITSSTTISQRFFGRPLGQSLRGLWVDWLQDRHPNPTEILFPPDPRYHRHIVEIHSNVGDFPLPPEGVAYA